MFISCSRVSLSFIAIILALVIGTAFTVSGQAIYNSIPSPLPGNVGSTGLEVAGDRELGDGVVFTLGSNRWVTTVKVVLSSYACTSGMWFNPIGTPNSCVTTPGATFNQPFTLNIYAVNPNLSPGASLSKVTQTFQIPYRPSSDAARCGLAGTPGGDGESWYSASDNSCYHGFATPITFDLTSAGILLPDRVIVSLTYNTTTSGYAPIGNGAACFATASGCPYDMLSIGTDGSAITGANVDPDGIYVNWINPAFSCNGALSGTVALDTPCRTGLHPQIEIAATAVDAFQVRYVSNLNAGDSVINFINTGTLTLPTGLSTTGNICVNVYTFDANEELISCCSCLVTPNGLNSLSAKTDLISNTLTPGVPSSIVIKLLASMPLGLTAGGAGGSCNASSPAAATLVPGLRAWGTTIHPLPTTPVTYGLTETEFEMSTLSPGELTKLTSFCGIIQANGSVFGICKSCRTGGLGADTQ
jgi:hypothetical protein